MTFKIYTEGSKSGTFEFSADAYERKKHMKNLKEICLSEGLHKIPFRKKFVGDGICVKYERIYSTPKEDSERDEIWNALRIYFESDSVEKSKSLGNKLENYFEKSIK